MSDPFNHAQEWEAAQTVEELTRDDEYDLPVADESTDGYFHTAFDPPKARESTSSFFSEGRSSQAFGPRGLSQERHSSKDRMFEDRPFSIRLGEPKDLEPRRLSSPLVPIPPARNASRHASSFHALEDLRMRPSSLSGLDPLLAEREKAWRRSAGDAVDTLRRKDDLMGARSSPIGTPVAVTRRYTASSRGTSPAVARELDLQAAADTYLLSLDPKDIDPPLSAPPNSMYSSSGVDPTWHYSEGPPSPQLPRSSRLTSTSPRLSAAKLSLELPKASFERPITDSPLQSPFSRVRLSGHSNPSRSSPLATPRSLAAAAANVSSRESATTFTRSPLTQKRALGPTARSWEDESSQLSDSFGSPESRYEAPRLVTPPRENLSEQLQQALQHHQHQYALNVITGASLMATHGHERQCFLDEACPICLRSEVQAEELMVTLRCKLLACNHVAHANCFKEAFLSISQHPFTFFKVNPSCVPPDQTRFVRGPRSGCIISLGLFHILSEVQFGHFKVENLGSTYDPKADQDCLNIAPLAETSTGTRPLFSLLRGRLVVECHSPATAERWRFQANYDLTGANSCVDLVYVDSESKISVLLAIIFNTGNTWAIERLTIELPPPPMTKRLSSPQIPQPQQQRTAPALSPLHRLSASNPTQPQPSQLGQSSNAQTVKSASQRLLQVQENAKTAPKHFKFPPSGSSSTGEIPSSPIISPLAAGGASGASVMSASASSFDKKPKSWDLPPNFASFEDHIPSLATTQLGSRFLQRKVEEGNPEFLALLFEQLLDFLPALIVDLFGNYLCQSMVCHATEEQRWRLLVKIKPHLVPVACARQGTRMVQKLVELSTSARDRRLILEALTGAWPSSVAEGNSLSSTVPCNLASSPQPESNAAPASGSTSPSQAMRSLSLAAAPSTLSSLSTSTSSIVLSDGVTPSPTVGSTTSTIAPTATTATANTDTTTTTTTTPSTSTTTTTTTSITTTSTTTDTSTAAMDKELLNWQVTDKTALLTLMKGSSGAHVIHAILDHWPVQVVRPIVLFAFEMSAELGVHQHGLCVLKKCLTVCTPEDLSMFVTRIQPQIFTFINDPYGNYLIQHLLERCDAPETDPEAIRVCSAINWDLHRSLQGHYPWLSRQKFSSNVVEKCLRTPDLKLRSSIIDELTKENTISQLLQCSFGNYVMQHVLEVASPVQAAQVITRIQPDLRLLRKNIRKKWERLLLRYDGDAMPISDKSSLSPVSSEASSQAPPPGISPLPPSASVSGASTSSTDFNSQLLAHNRNLANEFRAFQAMQENAHVGGGEYNDHKTGSNTLRKPRKPTIAVAGRPVKEFVPGEASANADRFRQQQFSQSYMSESPYVGYTYPQASYVPYVPRSFPPTPYDQVRFPGGTFRPQ